GHLHDLLVGLTGADDPVVLPRRDAPPLPFLDYFGVGLLDERPDSGKRFAAPVAELLDPAVDQLRGRFSLSFHNSDSMGRLIAGLPIGPAQQFPLCLSNDDLTGSIGLDQLSRTLIL